jgi:hypothetical protein
VLAGLFAVDLVDRLVELLLARYASGMSWQTSVTCSGSPPWVFRKPTNYGAPGIDVVRVTAGTGN